VQIATPQGTNAPDPKSFPGFAAARDAANWPDRRRGHSNFLTWAFMLSEIWAANLFFGGDATASDALSDPSQAGDQPQVPEYDPSFGLDWTSSDPKLDPGDPSKGGNSGASSSLGPYAGGGTSSSPSMSGSGAPGTNAPAAGGSGSAASLAASNQHNDASSSDASSAGDNLPSSLDPDVAVGSALDSVDGLLSNLDPSLASEIGLELSPLDLDADLQIDLQSEPLVDADLNVEVFGLDLGVEANLLSGLGLEAELAGIGGSLGQLIDGPTGLNVGGTIEGVTGLLGTTPVELSEIGGDATEIVTGLPVDDVLSDTAGTVVSVVPDTALLSPLNEVGALPAGDAIVFPNAAGSVAAAPDTLFNGAQYTDYNLALQTDVASGTVDLGTTEATSGDLLSVELASGDGHGGSQASELTTGDGLAEISSAEHDLLKGLSI
jgi:hypothetical protein